jgi:sphingomyelin phosphodiesterase acid-like 3
MLVSMSSRMSSRIFNFGALLVGASLLAGQGLGQKTASGTEVPVLMVSDIHFEPFWDPGKVQKLAAAPVPLWRGILASPDSPNRAQMFAELEQKCRTRGEDTSYPLLKSSLAAMKADAVGAKFVTLSGDLISHSFACRFKAAIPNAKPGDYEIFVQKTIGFVETELRRAFPLTPVYAALGNNDSNCEDYELDQQTPFLAEVGSLMTADVPAAQQKEALSAFAAQGNYSAPLPIRGTRLLVLDNLFQSAHYKACGGKADAAAAKAQVAWLRTQLEAARKKHEQVWVMAHIPPGVDPYATIRSMRNICAGEAPTLFLSSDAMASTLAEFGDVVRLAIFGHTHMDELRLLETNKPADGTAAVSPVPLKVIPSISPINGNSPSFVVAQVDAATATLRDYRVVAASNATGIDTKWTEAYNFRKAYGSANFNAKSVADLVAGFHADPQAQSAASHEYLKNYFVRDASLVLQAFWPQYVCALDHRTAETYRSCTCASGK